MYSITIYHGNGCTEQSTDMVDLFENTNELPKEVRTILENWDFDFPSYENCQKLVDELNKVGYTCDYGLDGVPYGLSPIMVKLESVGSIMNVDTKRVYPLNNDGSYYTDESESVFLGESVENDEWYESLSEVDKEVVDYYSQLI